MDELINEILIYGGDNILHIIWELCNLCKNKESTPEEWMDGIMFLIYKKGYKEDPYNYRGITLLRIVSKFYETLLNTRLTNFCETKKKLPEEQGVFRLHRGCIDQLFILISILNKRKHPNTFCCHIDVKKLLIQYREMGYGKNFGI